MGQTKSQGNYWVAGQFAFFALYALCLIFAPAKRCDWVWLPGVLLLAAGHTIMAVAFVTYSKVSQSRMRVSPEPNPKASLVDVGIYGKIRHPMYTGGLLAAFGGALIHGSLWTLGVTMIMALFFRFKALFEERELAKQYRDYDRYCERTGRFLPRIRRKQ
jgi:protein-S-isoprenylcysteine O-methyltransferase Ste14